MGKNIAIGIIVVLLIFFGVHIFLSHKTITQNASSVQKPFVIMTPKRSGTMTITSPLFSNYGTIPTNNTCDGKGVNPPLTFGDVPSNAKSLAMLMDDPDAPGGTYDHWVIYNIEPTVKEIAENSSPPGIQGLNGAGKIGYTPPCPPNREHRYFFKLYALDSTLAFDDPAKVTKQMVIDKMQGHIIDQAELIGRYNRPQNKK